MKPGWVSVYVAQHFGVHIDTLKGGTRSPYPVFLRRMMVYALLREGLSYRQIAAETGLKESRVGDLYLDGQLVYRECKDFRMAVDYTRQLVGKWRTK